MVRARRGWITGKIQRTAKSYWNHTGLIFMSKQFLPVGGPLLVEASFVGIEIHQMKRYSDLFDEYDLGVLRYPKLTDGQREEIVMGFILSNLDVTYDYSRLAGFFVGPLLKRISVKLWARFFKRMTHQENFVCTTFVHKAFHELSMHQRGGGFVETHDRGVESLQEEEFITPGDIAREPIFEWVFNKHE